MEVADGSHRIAFMVDEGFNLGSDEVDSFRKVLGCDHVRAYGNTSDGRVMIDCDYKRIYDND
jgi:hypothetical protein